MSEKKESKSSSPRPPRVFISYAHESDEFRKRVGELAEWLRNKGIRVETDHKFDSRIPDENLIVWMRDEIMQADKVLIICTELYHKRFWKKDTSNEGHGSTCEAALIRQALYNQKMVNEKFIPVLPDEGKKDHIPELFDGCTYFRFSTQQEELYQALVNPMFNQNTDPRELLRPNPARLNGPTDTRLSPNSVNLYDREREISALTDFLENPKRHPTAALVTGVAGLGKTEVCKAALKKWLQNEPEAAAYYIDLSEAKSGKESAGLVGKQLGHDNVDSIDTLRSYLGAGLYYLDNLESISEDDAGSDFLSSMKSCPGVRILASSRASFAALAKPMKLNPLSAEASLTLFRACWTGQPLADSLELRAFLEYGLGCHPLSIVLMARLGESYPLGKVMRQWKEKGISLARQPHGTKRSDSLDVSLHVTSDVIAKRANALKLWAIAALFPQGIPLRTIETMQFRAPTTDDDLIILVRHNILNLKDNRYVMLPPVARFAVEHAVKEEGEFSWSAVRESFYIHLWMVALSAHNTHSDDFALSDRMRLLEFFPVIHQFVAIESCSVSPDKGKLGILDSLLSGVYEHNIVLSELILADILRCLEGDKNRAKEAEVSLNLAYAHSILGRTEAAIYQYNKAITIYREEKDSNALSGALESLGRLEIAVGRNEEAESLLGEALEISEREGDLRRQASILIALAILKDSQGRDDQARKHYLDAIELFRNEKDTLELAKALESHGSFEVEQRNFEEARASLKEALEILQKVDHALGLGSILCALGGVEKENGKPEDAQAFFLKAIDVCWKQGDRCGLASALHSMGDLLRKEGRAEEALRHFEDCRRLYVDGSDPNMLACIDADRVRCLHALKRIEERNRAAEEALAVSKKANVKSVIAYVTKAFQEVGIPST